MSTLQNLVNLIVPIITLIIVALTLLYMAKQTKSIMLSFKEMRLNSKFNVMLSIKEHHYNLNNIILANPNLLNTFGYETSEALAYLLFSEYEYFFLFKNAEIMDDEFWIAKDNLVRSAISREFMRKAWFNVILEKKEYHPEFMNYINRIYREIDENNKKIVIEENSL